MCNTVLVCICQAPQDIRYQKGIPMWILNSGDSDVSVCLINGHL